MTASDVRSLPTPGHAPIERVLILGRPGAGKTSFARTLGRETMLPVFHLDDHYWGPGWSRADPGAWIAWQQELVRRKRWVIDGLYMSSVPLRVTNADLIVMIDAPAITCVLRTLFRAWRIRRGQRQFLPARVRGGRTSATKDLLSLLAKILRFRHDVKMLMRLAASTTKTRWVAAVLPDPLGIRDRIAGHPARGRREWTVLPFLASIRFVVEAIEASRLPGGGLRFDQASGDHPQSGDER